MKKILSIVLLASISILLAGCGESEEWIAKNSALTSYLTSKYPEEEFETTTSKEEQIEYIETKSKTFETFPRFASYVADNGDGTYEIEECWQSLKYANMLTSDCNSVIPMEHYFYIDFVHYEGENVPIYGDYNEYFNNVQSKSMPNIYLVVKDEFIDDNFFIMLDEIANFFPQEFDGVINIYSVPSNFEFKNQDDWYSMYSDFINQPNKVTIPFNHKNFIYENKEFNKATVDTNSNLITVMIKK